MQHVNPYIKKGRKHMKTKRILSLTLVLAVIISAFFGITAYAETDDEAKWGASIDSLTQSGTLEKAISDANMSASIKYIQLQKDINTDYSYNIQNGNFTLDLYGSSITASSYAINIIGSAPGPMVTITDTSVSQTGTVKTTSNAAAAVIINNGTLVINGGSFIAEYCTALMQNNNSSVTINNGNFAGKCALYADSSDEGTPELTITGGSFKSTNEDMYTIFADGNATIKGGSFTTPENSADICYNGKKLDISEYEFNNLKLSVYYKANITNIKLPTECTICDPYYYQQDSITSAGSYILYTDEDAVPSYSAQVFYGKDKDSLSTDAIPLGTVLRWILYDSNTKDIHYIKLNEDIEGSVGAYNTELTIDLNGCSITSKGYETVAAYANSVITVTDTSEDKNGTIKLENDENYKCYTLNATYGGKIIVEDGNIESDTLALYVSSADAIGETNYPQSSAEIKGGTFKVNTDTADYTILNDGILTISGGKFYAGNKAIFLLDGGKTPSSATITGGDICSSGSCGTVDYAAGKPDVSNYGKASWIVIHNSSGEEVILGENTIKIPEGYALCDTDNILQQYDYLPNNSQRKYGVCERWYIAEKVTADNIANSANSDAVGYYVTDVPAKDLANLNWHARMVSGIPLELTKAVNPGNDIESTGNVSFGIVLYGRYDGGTLYDEKLNFGTADIVYVYVGK